jgi:cystathionine gamma-synthase/methionine-gamma-lyase
MAAIHGALLAASSGSGSTILAALDLYGATYSLVKNLLGRLGFQARFVDASHLDRVESELKKRNRPDVLLVETISNPLLKVADLPELARLAHEHGTEFLVDSTFATPYLVNPLQHGADYVIHSATKALSGHGDVLAGVTVTSLENKQKLFEIQKVVGGNLGPFEAWLALRGLKTLPLRMQQQCQNALRMAEWLQQHPRIARVHYPGLESHPQHQLASQLFAGKGYGSVLSFEIAGADQSAVFRFMERLRLVLPATTLGDIYSLVLHPASTSHRSLSPEERARAGIPDNLVRLSAGIEAAEDLLGDLDQALNASKG